MLIVSPFHDYYDRITAFGVDKTVVYHRKPRTRSLVKGREPEPPHSADTGRHFGTVHRRARARLIGFCGKIYPMVEVSREGDTAYCYSADGTVKAMRRRGFEIPRTGWWRDTSLTSMQGIVATFETHRWKGLERIFVEEKTPVFIMGEGLPIEEGNPLETKATRQTLDLITVNPRLRDWGFQHVVDPASAFQQIYMYISGVLGVTAPEMVEIDDKHKAIAHGHDGKYSFKKTPKGQWR